MSTIVDKRAWLRGGYRHPGNFSMLGQLRVGERRHAVALRPCRSVTSSLPTAAQLAQPVDRGGRARRGQRMLGRGGRGSYADVIPCWPSCTGLPLALQTQRARNRL